MISYIYYSKAASPLAIPAGQQLFVEGGESAAVMYVLVSGSAEISVGNRVVEMLAPGDLVGEVGLLDEGPRTATVTALTDCDFIAIDRKRFRHMIKQEPDFALEVMRVLASRLRRADSLIPEIEDI